MKEGWEYKTLGEVGSFKRGGNFSKKDFVKDGFPCIHYGQIHTKFGIFTEKHLSCVPANIVKKERCAKKGDLVIAITSEDEEGSCKCTAWMADYEAYVGGHTAIYSHTLNPLFMSYYFKSPIFQIEKLNYTHGFKVVEISPKDIAKIKIPIPSLEEQRRIVSYLDSSFKLIDEIKNKALKTLTEAKALFQSALAEAMEPKEGWEEKTFGEICTYHKEQKRENGYKYIGMENIESGTGNLIGYGSTDNVLSSTFFFKKGEVLYGRLRPYLKKVYIAEFDGCCSTEIFPIKTNGVLPGLIKYWFLTDEITNKINDTSAGCRMPRGNMNEVLQFHLYIPSDKQSQKRIVSHLDKLSSKVRAMEEKYQKMVEECDALKQAMLRDVFE